MNTPADNEPGRPLAVPLSDQLGLGPERAAFERWRDIERPSLMRHSIVYSDLADLQAEAIAWDAWNACWPLARAAIYSAEQAQIEAPLRAEIERLRAELAEAVTALPQAVRNERERWELHLSATRKLAEANSNRGDDCGMLARTFLDTLKAMKA